MVKLTKLALWMPHMEPSVSVETRLLSYIDHGGKTIISWLDVTTATTTKSVNNFTWQITLAKNNNALLEVCVVLQDEQRIKGDNIDSLAYDI